ncbi:MAG: chemotaxis protein CheB [Granulosicoccus sp.]
MIAIACTSEATVPFDQKMLKELYEEVLRKNRQLGLTGYLSWKDDHFFQYLEGPENAIEEILHIIDKDTRQTILRTLLLGPIEQRRFSHWEMLNVSGVGVPDIRIQDLIEDVARSASGSGDQVEDEDSRRILLQMLDQMSALHRDNHKKAMINDMQGVDIGEEPPFVVVFGASAGGLYPLQAIIRSIKPNLHAAFIIIQHFAPEIETAMDTILQRETLMNVCIATRAMKITAGRVYLIPPGENLEVSSGRFDLSKQHRSGHGPQYPIDICFKSIAREYGDRAVAIILSGTGSDGSRGAKILNEAGGVVLAQNPDSAEFNGMPNISIESGMVHQILGPSEIADYINNLSGDYIHDSLALWPARRAQYVSEVVSYLKDSHVDFSQYKSETLFRRIERRRVKAGISTSDDYVQFVRSSEKEREELRDDILITVTSFFRDSDAWGVLKESITPIVESDWEEGKIFRVWVPACSTGEEAYTVAIILIELLEKLDKQIEFKIYATDIERKALQHASAGIYSSRALAEVSPERRQRFFMKMSDGYQVVSQLRNSVIFAPHNFIKNAPFTRMHLVTCRNVLIYMQPELQQIALKMLHFALNVNGVLFLGPSETLGGLQSEFFPVQREWNQYKKLRNLRLPLQLSLERFQDASLNYRAPTVVDPFRSTAGSKSGGLLRLSLEALSQYSLDTNVLIDTERSVMLVLSDPSGLLQYRKDEPALDLLMVVPEELRASLGFAIKRAFKENTLVSQKQLRCHPAGQPAQIVDMDVMPHTTPGDSEAVYALVVFSKSTSAQTGHSAFDHIENTEAEQLKIELEETRRALEEAVQDLETSSHEQRSINEQLSSANEELQSTNEELQSVNEELYSVNFEYQTKIHELSDLNQDLDNLLDSTDLGVIFLDSDLCIRRFTEVATQTVNLLPADIGRPFVDLTHNLNYKDMIHDLRRVLSMGNSLSREISRTNREPLQVGIHPYRAGNGLAQGVLVMFRDIKSSSAPVRVLEDPDTAH